MVARQDCAAKYFHKDLIIITTRNPICPFRVPFTQLINPGNSCHASDGFLRHHDVQQKRVIMKLVIGGFQALAHLQHTPMMYPRPHIELTFYFSTSSISLHHIMQFQQRPAHEDSCVESATPSTRFLSCDGIECTTFSLKAAFAVPEIQLVSNPESETSPRPRHFQKAHFAPSPRLPSIKPSSK